MVVMFLETAVALFALGFAAGVAASYLRVVRPLDRQLADMRREERRALNRLRYRSEVRRQHLGTPYITPARDPRPASELPFDSIGAFDVSDNDRWSRKAPDLKVLQ